MQKTPLESFHLSLQVRILFLFRQQAPHMVPASFILSLKSLLDTRPQKTSRSANTSSEKDSNSNSVTQNEPAVQEDSNSVKQNKSNSTDIEHDWSKNIEKGNSFLKRNSYPELKPSRQIKYKPSEADLKARAEEALILRPVRLVLFLLILTITSKK